MAVKEARLHVVPFCPVDACTRFSTRDALGHGEECLQRHGATSQNDGQWTSRFLVGLAHGMAEENVTRASSSDWR